VPGDEAISGLPESCAPIKAARRVPRQVPAHRETTSFGCAGTDAIGTGVPRQHCGQLPRAVPLARTESPYYGLCHGDAGSANAHVTADGRLTLFDFDMCGVGWRAYDIATFLIDEPESIAASFLEGYTAVRALTDTELASLPLFQIVQSIWVLGLRADYINDWGSSLLSERLLNHILSFITHTMETMERGPVTLSTALSLSEASTLISVTDSVVLLAQARLAKLPTRL